jgi:predicted transcriptional regulator
VQLSADHAVTTPAYSEVHLVMAKQRALGRKRVEDGDASSAR